MNRRARRKPQPKTLAVPHWKSNFGAPITALCFGADQAMFALGDGTVRLWHPGDRGLLTVEAHIGAVLSAAIDERGTGLLTGGDDGQLVHTRPDGTFDVIATSGGRWIEHVAATSGGLLAWSHGRMVEFAAPADDARHEVELPSACGGLAFEPDRAVPLARQPRLAIGCYGGVRLASFTAGHVEESRLDWKGSHIAVSWSPDARFLVTAMQEAALHVWRLADMRDLHMGGFPAKPRTMSWCEAPALLATSGAPGGLVWPFAGETGPEGKHADILGQREQAATAVAWHPASPVLAIGFRDGMVVLAEPDVERAPVLRPADGHALSALAWRTDGRLLAWGTEQGDAAMVDLSNLSGQGR